MTGSTVASDKPELTRSNLALPGRRYSGSSTGPSASSSSIAGMLMRKTDPHQKCSSRMPESTGPTAIPLVITAVQIAIAVDRCFASWNMFRMRPSVDGINVAPATPSSALAAISISALCE